MKSFSRSKKTTQERDQEVKKGELYNTIYIDDFMKMYGCIVKNLESIEQIIKHFLSGTVNF